MEHLDELIAQRGWALQGIFAAEGDEATAPWVYTVGLSRQDRPEMIMTGLPAQVAGTLLNTVGDMSVGDLPPRPGTCISGVLAEGYKLAVTTVTDPTEGDWFNVGWSWARRHHVHFDHRGVIQLVWPQVDGTFPALSEESQVLLGPAWWADAQA
jgi:hypothetical protein